MLLILTAAQAQEAHLVKNINLSDSSNPQFLTDVNGTLYFSATDGVHGTELWKSDGTSAGTVIVEDINPGIGESNPENLTRVDGTLYFSATNAVNGTELWTLGSNPTNTTTEDEKNGGCFIATADNVWFSTHDMKAVRKSKESVLFTASGSQALAQPHHAPPSVMADFVTTCSFVRTVLPLSLVLTSFGILIWFTIVRGKSDPVSNHQESKGRGAYRLFHNSIRGKIPGKH
jgi:ELWxxDGT repeat protein